MLRSLCNGGTRSIPGACHIHKVAFAPRCGDLRQRSVSHIPQKPPNAGQGMDEARSTLATVTKDGCRPVSEFYTEDAKSQEQRSTLPASIHLALSRNITRTWRAAWDEPSFIPIVERLPPLPMIHDRALVDRALNVGSEGSDLETVMTMAQIGDRLILGHEAFSKGRDRYPISRDGPNHVGGARTRRMIAEDR